MWLVRTRYVAWPVWHATPRPTYGYKAQSARHMPLALAMVMGPSQSDTHPWPFLRIWDSPNSDMHPLTQWIDTWKIETPYCLPCKWSARCVQITAWELVNNMVQCLSRACTRKLWKCYWIVCYSSEWMIVNLLWHVLTPPLLYVIDYVNGNKNNFCHYITIWHPIYRY